jgi:DNA repair protein RadD
MPDIILREYQQRVVEAVREKARNGKRRILVVLPTGSGKTFVAAELVRSAYDKGNKVLALMHRRGLVDQMIERFTDYNLETGCIMAGIDHNLDAQCQIASLWTYTRRLKLAEQGNTRFFVDAPFIIIDEAHHATNNTYKKILKQYPDSFVVGFTATPTLSDGRGLGEYFDSMVDVVSMEELLKEGNLVPGEYYGPSTPDLRSLKIVQGDYEKKGLDEKINQPKIIGDVVDNWFKQASDLQTMVFGINRKHSKALCNEFIKHGVNAEYLDANNDDEERSDVLRRFRAGDTQVICQVGLYTEGSDIPEIDALVLARPTRSLGLHRQILGRGARPRPGKEKFLVLDHGGSVKLLGYYEDEMDWSLDGRKGSCKPKKPRKKEKTIMTCEMCKRDFTGPRCPNCGHEIKDYGKKIEAIEAELVKLNGEKVTKKYTKEEKQKWFSMLEYIRREKGYAPGWTANQYRSRIGCWPRGMEDRLLVPDDEVNKYVIHQRIRYAKSRKAQNAQA